MATFLTQVGCLFLGLKRKYSRNRANAAQALGRPGMWFAVGPLSQALTDEDSSVVRSAATSLGKIGSKRAVKPLIKVLEHWHDGVRGAVATALGELADERAVEPLILALEDKHQLVRKNAVNALGKLRDLRAVEPLIRTFRNGDFIDAVNALANIGDPRGIEPLIWGLGSSRGCRRNVARGLAKLGEQHWQEWIKGESNDFDRLLNGGHPRAAEIVLVAVTEHNNPEAASVAGRLPPSFAFDSMVKAVELGKSHEAATALGKLGDSRAVQPLIDALGRHNDYRFDLPRCAAKGLGELGDARAVAPIISKVKALLPLQNGNPVGFLLAAASALGELGDPRAFEPLMEIWKWQYGGGEWTNRVVVAEALGQLGDQRAVKVLIEALPEQPTARWKEIAVEALGKLGDRRAVDALINSFSFSPEIRRAAGRALAKLGELDFDILIKGDDTDFMSLARSGDRRIVKPLVDALERGESERMAAARALIWLAEHQPSWLIQDWQKIFGLITQPYSAGYVLEGFHYGSVGIGYQFPPTPPA